MRRQSLRSGLATLGARNGLWAGLAALLFVGLVVAAVLFATDTPALYYLNTPFPLERRVLRPGDAVTAYAERCNRFGHSVPYHYARKLVALGGAVRANVLEEGQTFAPPGCVRAWVPLLTVPATTAPGLYRLEAINVVNGQWRAFEVSWASEAFSVEVADAPHE